MHCVLTVFRQHCIGHHPIPLPFLSTEGIIWQPGSPGGQWCHQSRTCILSHLTILFQHYAALCHFRARCCSQLWLGTLKAARGMGSHARRASEYRSISHCELLTGASRNRAKSGREYIVRPFPRVAQGLCQARHLRAGEQGRPGQGAVTALR